MHARGDTMKAIVQDRYGSPDVLELREIDRPVHGDDDVLVRVHAAGVDQGVWHEVAGVPYLFRIAGIGVRAPKNPIPGHVWVPRTRFAADRGAELLCGTGRVSARASLARDRAFLIFTGRCGGCSSLSCFDSARSARRRSRSCCCATSCECSSGRSAGLW
jgi:hypothetical protein